METSLLALHVKNNTTTQKIYTFSSKGEGENLRSQERKGNRHKKGVCCLQKKKNR